MPKRKREQKQSVSRWDEIQAVLSSFLYTDLKNLVLEYCDRISGQLVESKALPRVYGSMTWDGQSLLFVDRSNSSLKGIKTEVKEVSAAHCSNGFLYVVTPCGCLKVINVQGEAVVTRRLANIECDIWIDGDEIFLLHDQKPQIRVLNRSTLDTLREFDCPEEGAGICWNGISVATNVICLITSDHSSRPHKGVALMDRFNGSLISKWSLGAEKAGPTRALLIDNQVFIGGPWNEIKVYSADDGQLIESFGKPLLVSGALDICFTGTVLYILDGNKTVYTFQ